MKILNSVSKSVRIVSVVGAMSFAVTACAQDLKGGVKPDVEPTPAAENYINAKYDIEKGVLIFLDEKGEPLPFVSIKEHPIRETEIRRVAPYTVLYTWTNPHCMYSMSLDGMYQRYCPKHK